MKKIELKIPGKPIAKARPRFARRGKFVTTYNDQETEESKFLWEVKQQLDIKKPYECPISVEVGFYFDRPKSQFGTGKNAGVIKGSAPFYHIKRPDLDNLEKFVLDCLNGYVWRDDSQIFNIESQKLYVENTQPETILIIKIWEAN